MVIKLKRKYSLVLAVITTIGLISTFIGTMIDNPDSPILSGLGILKYFTIQSNLFIATYFWLNYIKKGDHKLLSSTILGAISVYITITFLGYAIFLEAIYDPTGIALVGTILNHYVTPLLVIAFVIIFRKGYKYQFSDLKKWIIYLLVYLVFFLIYGAITSDYYYVFLDLNELGLVWFLISVTGLISLFLLLSCSLIYISKSKEN